MEQAAMAEAPMPRHVAIILDGNGRWASQRGFPRTEAHRRGVESVRVSVRAAIELGVTHVTLYTFSSDDWQRPQEEVFGLMTLLKRFIRRDLAELHEQNVKLNIIGTNEGVEDEIVALIR